MHQFTPKDALPDGNNPGGSLQPGHLACAGCGLPPALDILRQVLGHKCVFVVPACCYTIVDGAYPFSASGVPLLHCAFETAAATAAGVKAGMEASGAGEAEVVAIAGDGGTFDIGFQALSSAAERNENILYFCYDNEAYMNTGIQKSSATPLFAWTTTTPQGDPKNRPKKDLGAIMAAHRIPYFASASLSDPADLFQKLQTAKRMRGFRMIHYLCPCPTGWKAESSQMVALARKAVECRLFPLYEIFAGERLVVTANPKPVPVEKYLEMQGRFRGLTREQKEEIQKEADGNWRRLTRNALSSR